MTETLSLRATCFTALLLCLTACDAGVKIDPEGYQCDPGSVCPAGFTCVDNTCRRGGPLDTSCDGVVCDAPPQASCSDGTTLQTHVGRCVSGTCLYDPVQRACAAACMNGACVDPCANVTCVQPPGAACIDGTTLRTFAPTGTCNATGQCDYAPTDTACPNGCLNGVCKGVDLCAQNNVMCTQPPPAACVDASTRRTFALPATCEPGTGQCKYTTSDMACPAGCALGLCLTPSLTFTQVGPRVRFAVNALDVAPGSSGNTAIAVGNAGKLSRWDGASWTEVTTGTSNALNSVAFVTGTVAFTAGDRGTLFSVRSTGLTPITLASSGQSKLIAVSGRSENEVLVAGADGEWWRQRGGTWQNGTLPMTAGTPSMVAAYLDESQRERIVGRCGNQRCTAYRNPSSGTPMWTVQTQGGGTSFGAVGGGFDIPTTNTSSVVMVGGGLDLYTHDSSSLQSGPYSTVNESPAITGGAVVGLTAQATTTGRDVYVLTSSAGQATGHLFRLERTLGLGISSTDALQTYYGEEHLSPNDANGVLVAEVRRAQGVNNIFRRGPVTNEALDVGEDLIGASVDATSTLTFVSAYGDIITRRPTVDTFDFRRPPAYDWDITGFEARNGTGLLLVGEDTTQNKGLITRFNNNTFTQLLLQSNERFTAVCRVSDTEAWVVGTGGALYRVNTTSATRVAVPTSNDLLAVDCTAGAAVACGASGTVLRLSAGTWSSISTGLGASGDVRTCKLVGSGVLVGGDGFLSTWNNGSWTAHPGQPGLRQLVVRSPSEVYGSFTQGNTSTIARFNGATWSPALLTVPGTLGGGVQVGQRVVWGGTLGVMVDGR